MKNYIIDLEDKLAHDIFVSGGKGANLSRLHNASIPVPGGFIITAQCYGDIVLGKQDIMDLIMHLSELSDLQTDTISLLSRQIREKLRTSIFPTS